MSSLASSLNTLAYQPENSSINRASFINSSEGWVGVMAVAVAEAKGFHFDKRDRACVTQIHNVLCGNIPFNSRINGLRTAIFLSWCMTIHSGKPAIPGSGDQTPISKSFLMLVMGWRSSSLTEGYENPLVQIKQGAVPGVSRKITYRSTEHLTCSFPVTRTP